MLVLVLVAWPPCSGLTKTLALEAGVPFDWKMVPERFAFCRCMSTVGGVPPQPVPVHLVTTPLVSTVTVTDVNASVVSLIGTLAVTFQVPGVSERW